MVKIKACDQRNICCEDWQILAPVWKEELLTEDHFV